MTVRDTTAAAERVRAGRGGFSRQDELLLAAFVLRAVPALEEIAALPCSADLVAAGQDCPACLARAVLSGDAGTEDR